MTIYTPYTYLIGWSKENKWYYGVRHSNSTIPEKDLWVIYNTSSNYVKNFREEHGEPDVIQVRRTFDSAEAAIEWEHKVLCRMGVVTDDKWLNMTDNKSFSSDVSFDWTGIKRSKENRTKISNSLKGSKHTEERCKNISKSKKGVSINFNHKAHSKHCANFWTTEQRNSFKQYGGRNSVRVQFEGKEYSSITDFSRKYGVSTVTAHKWIKKGKLSKV